MTGRDGAVRQALAGHLAGLHALCFPPGEAWSAESMLALITTPGCIVSHDETGLVLYRVAADEAEILTIGVLPGMRRQGRGRALLDIAAAGALAAGAGRLFLEVAAANRAAIALYEGAGFTWVGRRRRYYPDGDDALVMVLNLAEAC